MSIGRGALLRGTIGIAISVAAVWILVHSVDVGTALQVLGRASPLWIAVMLVTAILDISSRGARWRVLLAPIAPLPYRCSVHGINTKLIGGFTTVASTITFVQSICRFAATTTWLSRMFMYIGGMQKPRMTMTGTASAYCEP